MPTLPSAQARALVAQGALLVDVRSREEYASGHLEGAINVPLAHWEEALDSLPPPPRVLVVYCEHGIRSARAAHLLKDEGYEVWDLGSHARW